MARARSVGRRSPQFSAAGARIIREEAKDAKKLARAQAAEEDINAAYRHYIRTQLIPYLVGLSTFVGFAAPPEPPSED